MTNDTNLNNENKELLGTILGSALQSVFQSMDDLMENTVTSSSKEGDNLNGIPKLFTVHADPSKAGTNSIFEIMNNIAERNTPNSSATKKTATTNNVVRKREENKGSGIEFAEPPKVTLDIRDLTSATLERLLESYTVEDIAKEYHVKAEQIKFLAELWGISTTKKLKVVPVKLLGFKEITCGYIQLIKALNSKELAIQFVKNTAEILKTVSCIKYDTNKYTALALPSTNKITSVVLVDKPIGEVIKSIEVQGYIPYIQSLKM